jgi:hypothetical protein
LRFCQQWQVIRRALRHGGSTDGGLERSVVLDQAAGDQLYEVEAEARALMVELKDLVAGHPHKIDVGDGNGGADSLLARRKHADLAEHVTGTEIFAELIESDNTFQNVEHLGRALALEEKNLILLKANRRHERIQDFDGNSVSGIGFGLGDHSARLLKS